MPITEQQRQERKGWLGSSDVAAILGVDKYKNAYDVYLDKTGKVVDENIESEVMLAGTLFEDGIIKYAERELGEILTDACGQALFYQAPGLPIASHPDGIVVANNNPVEAKTSGLFGPLMDGWGDNGTDEVPDRVLIQVHVHMLCTEKDICHVVSFLGGRGFAMYKVNRDDKLIEIICDKSTEFWYEYVDKDIPPPDVMPSPQMIKRLKREPDKVVEIPEELYLHWSNAKEILEGATVQKETAQTAMLNALADAEAGQWGTGEMITYLEQTKNGIDAKQLRIDLPDIAEKYKKASTFRVVRLKKAKKIK